MNSTPPKRFNSDLTRVDGQARLGLPMKALEKGLNIALSEIVSLPTKKAALMRCVSLANKDDKIADHLDIDKAQWSRIKTGTANFPENLETKLMLFCENYIPLIWQIYQCGFDPDSIKPLQSEMEKAINEKDREIADLRNEREVTLKLLRDLKAVD